MTQKNFETASGELIKVVVCEADQRLTEVYGSLVKLVCSRNGINVRIKSFSSVNAMLFDLPYRNINESDIIFLNKRIHNEDGFQIAQKLRNSGYMGEIIYSTDSAERVTESFDVGAFYYLLYPDLTISKFEAIFVGCIKKIYRKRKRTFTFRGIEGSRSLEYSEVWYLRVIDKTVGIYREEELVDTFNGTLSQLQERLEDKGMIRVHRSYIVNLRHISKIGKKEVWLGNSIVIPIGVRRQNLLDKSIKEWSKIDSY